MGTRGGSSLKEWAVSRETRVDLLDSVSRWSAGWGKALEKKSSTGGPSS